MRRTCKHCGADVGSAEFDICGRHACQARAAREREPGSDDGDRREPTRCAHCRTVGRGSPCPQCAALIADLGDAVVAPPPETEDVRRARFHAARVECVNASFERGRRCLLARALDPEAWHGLDRPQPR